MARYTGPKTRISRAYGVAIVGNFKVLKKKNYPPGMHGKKRKKKSEYALQLAAKQIAKHTYGLLERQFRNLVAKSAREKGVTGVNLLQKLEARLDNVVYRLGLASSRPAARQLVSHGHIVVNDASVNIPSYALQPGDVISLTSKAKEMLCVKESLAAYRHEFSWLSWQENELKGTYLEHPVKEQIPEKIDEQAIVELYAK